MKCNSCDKDVKGIYIGPQENNNGILQYKLFNCPHCGTTMAIENELIHDSRIVHLNLLYTELRAIEKFDLANKMIDEINKILEAA